MSKNSNKENGIADNTQNQPGLNLPQTTCGLEISSNGDMHFMPGASITIEFGLEEANYNLIKVSGPTPSLDYENENTDLLGKNEGGAILDQFDI